MKYKIGYYIIDDESITIMFYDSMFLGQSNIPAQLYVDKDDYRYGIIKSEIEKQTDETKVIDSCWFQIPALTRVKGFSVDTLGNVSFNAGAVDIPVISKHILKNLVDYYNTPIYDLYVSHLQKHNWIIPGNTYMIIFTVEGKTKDSLQSCHSLITRMNKQLCNAPYVKLEDASLKLVDDRIIEIIDFERVLEKFWKCEKTRFNEISKSVRQNQKVFEKLINTLSINYIIEPSIISFIAENCTDFVKMDNLLLTGMITRKE